MTKEIDDTKIEDVVEDVVEDDIDLDAEVELGDDATDDQKDKTIKTLNAQKKHWRKKHDDLVTSSKKDDKDTKDIKKDVKKDASSKDMSSTDLYALIDAKIPQEDVSTVRKFAKMEGITIPEALKSSLLKSILKGDAEMRETANASNTQKTGKTKGAISDDQLLADAKKGIMPESDEDMTRLSKLRLGLK